MLAIATESIVKLVAFVAVGVFVTFCMFDGPLALFARALEQPDTAAVLTREPVLGTLAGMTLLSLFAIVLLPRQFHVTVVENNSEARDQARRLAVPALSRADQPVRRADRARRHADVPARQVDSDMFVLALPLAAELRPAHHCGLHRRPFGGDRHGDRRDRSRSPSWCRTTS